MPVQDAPPSVVRTIEAHGGAAHGAVPRTQPSAADTKVMETGLKPGGTGPPAGRPVPPGMSWRRAQQQLGAGSRQRPLVLDGFKDPRTSYDFAAAQMASGGLPISAARSRRALTAAD